jgi:hypothetical protein
LVPEQEFIGIVKKNRVDCQGWRTKIGSVFGGFSEENQRGDGRLSGL